jgi:hypothetical protein
LGPGRHVQEETEGSKNASLERGPARAKGASQGVEAVAVHGTSLDGAGRHFRLAVGPCGGMGKINRFSVRVVGRRGVPGRGRPKWTRLAPLSRSSEAAQRLVARCRLVPAGALRDDRRRSTPATCSELYPRSWPWGGERE